MIKERSRRLIAIVFFSIWIGILYLGADHPPPIGFLWLVLLCFIAATAVYVRVPVYAEWAENRRKYRFERVFVEGCIAGLVFALVTLLFNGTGEPGIQPTWIDEVMWFLVLALVGAFNAVAVYIGAVLVNRFTNKSDKI